MRNREWILGACIAGLAFGAVYVISSHRSQVTEPGVPSIAATEARTPEDPGGVAAAVDLADSRTPVLGEAQGNRSVLTVLDDRDQPVEGALVHVESDAGWALAGKTRADGRLLFDGGRGVVRHPDYLPGDFEVPAEGRETLVLARSGAIDGTVVGLDPEGLVECRIVARQRCDGATSLVEELERNSPRVIEVEGCRPDGSFRLTGVRPGREYVVEGTLPGMASSPATVTAGTAENPAHVVVEMIDVWGAQVVFAGPGGDRLHCPDRVDVSRSSSAEHFIPTLPPGFRYASGIYGLSEHRLSGGVRLGMFDGRYRALILMTPEAGAGQGPASVSFTFQLPGYEPSSGEVLIRPYRESPPPLEVELTPRAESFGALDLEFSGTQYLEEVETRFIGAEYELRLEGENGERIAVKYSVPFPARERLEGIPSGTYDVVFEGLGKSLKVVPGESPVRIGPESTPHLTVELGAFGSIEVEAIQADGSLYDSGPIKVQLITETEPGLGRPMYYHLSGPPYVIRHVAPGPHYLVLLTPAETVYTDPDAVPLDTVLVSESSVTTARFFLP